VVNIGRWSSYEGGQLDRFYCIMKPTWCTFHSVYRESRTSTCFEHYMLILRRRYTNGIWYIACEQCQLLVARLQWNCITPSAVCVSPPEDEQAMLEIRRIPLLSINWMESASSWFQYNENKMSSLTPPTFDIWIIQGVSKRFERQNTFPWGIPHYHWWNMAYNTFEHILSLVGARQITS
jgi:hypothetical protein